VPDVNIVSPNTAINISGIFPVDFNVIDPNHDDLNFKLAYSSTAGSFQNVIVTNSSLSSLCTTTNWVRTTRCTYSWNTAGVQGVYYLDINVFDSRLAGHTDPSDSNFTVNFAPLQLRTDYVNTYALKSGLGGMDINWAISAERLASSFTGAPMQGLIGQTLQRSPQTSTLIETQALETTIP